MKDKTSSELIKELVSILLIFLLIVLGYFLVQVSFIEIQKLKKLLKDEAIFFTLQQNVENYAPADNVSVIIVQDKEKVVHIFGHLGLKISSLKATTRLSKLEESRIRSLYLECKNLFESFLIPIVKLDKKLKVLDVNNSFLNVFEYERDECIGKNI